MGSVFSQHLCTLRLGHKIVRRGLDEGDNAGLSTRHRSKLIDLSTAIYQTHSFVVQSTDGGIHFSHGENTCPQTEKDLLANGVIALD